MKSNYYLLLITLTLFNSCISTKNTIYFQNVNNSDIITIKEQETFICNKNSLKISISSKDPLAIIPLNLTSITNYGMSDNSNLPSNTIEDYKNQQDLIVTVNDSGNINFPLLGEIKIAGLKKDEATKFIKEKLYPYVKDPIVSIEFYNYKITILGEVNKPGLYTIKDNQINVLEAIGLAGDITSHGKRNDILLIRKLENGNLKFINFNLTNNEIFTSPYFYLQPNDILYVKPTKQRQLNFKYLIKKAQTLHTLKIITLGYNKSFYKKTN